MDACIPSELHPLLQEYMNWAKQEMAGQVTAFYLVGSVALGEFIPRLSDIDFIAVLNSKASSTNFENIRRIHRKIEKNYPWKMSGLYLQGQDLGRLDHRADPFPAYHDGRLAWSDHFELSSVTWWILKNHGIAVFGLPPQTLGITVDMEHLIRLQHKNLNTYWASWTTRPDRILVLLSDWGVQWTVLSVLRQFYTIRERKITSKIKAGEYALSCLPVRWHRIIRDAIILREAPKPDYHHSRIRRAKDTFDLIRYVIGTCNEFSEAGHDLANL